MKLVLIILIGLILLISGCATLKTGKSNETISPEKSPVITQQSSPSPTLKSTAKTGPSPYAAQEPAEEYYSSPPLISSTSLNPSNPALGDVFELKITADDDKAIKEFRWTSTKPLSGSSSGTFDCNLQKTCSNTWKFTSTE